MADRKLELERKKAKLLAMREEKKKKEEENRLSKLELKNGAKMDIRSETEEMLKKLGIEPENPNLTLNSAGDSSENSQSLMSSKQRKLAALKMSDVTTNCDIPPQTFVNYSKETQTLQEQGSRDKDAFNDYYVPTFDEEWDDDEFINTKSPLDDFSKISNLSNIGKSRMSKAGKQSLQVNLNQGPDTEDFEELKDTPKIPTLTDEERNQMLLSDGFLKFFNRSSRFVERALCIKEDLMYKDYTGADTEVVSKTDELITLDRQFYDEHWSKHRCVTCVDWSTNFPELMLAAYSANEQAPNEPSGVCCLWNMQFASKTSPEYVFHCQCPITSASMSRFHPNLIIAGTYSGQIVLWDTRSTKRTPVQRSPLAAWAHTHPVFAVQVVGTKNAHNIVSLASDGSLRAWHLENLSQPVENSKVLETSNGGGLYDVFPTCMSFFANDVNNYALGAENGNAYTEQRHSSRSGARQELSKNIPYESHCGPITSIHCHPSPGETSYSYLFLTTSLDWTTRLWSIRDHKPLHTFDDSFECVYDAQWSPVHPAVFATADGSGRLDIWDLNRDFEVPAVRRQISTYGDEKAVAAGKPQVTAPMSSGQTPNGGVALSKCRWDHSGGLLAAGDVCGRVHVYSVNENLAKPSPTAWSELSNQLTEMKNYSLDVEQ